MFLHLKHKLLENIFIELSLSIAYYSVKKNGVQEYNFLS